MFILGTAEYLPARIIDNAHFARVLHKPAEWFMERTGIRERRRCEADESLHTMGVAAVEALQSQGVLLTETDVVIAVSYTPLDTIGTLAHVIQRRFSLTGAKALYLSTACSSFLDALDIAGMYLRSGLRRVLLVAAEHNSAYSRDDDPASGHLWGDGASATLLGSASTSSRFEVVRVDTQGLGDLGHGPAAVSLTRASGLTMPLGREVFTHACQQMTLAVQRILKSCELAPDDVRLLIPHQANKRILDHVAETLGFGSHRVALTIDSLGNTGSASIGITLHRFADRLRPGEFAVLAAFGGGYSVGAALLRRTG